MTSTRCVLCGATLNWYAGQQWQVCWSCGKVTKRKAEDPIPRGRQSEPDCDSGVAQLESAGTTSCAEVAGSIPAVGFVVGNAGAVPAASTSRSHGAAASTRPCQGRGTGSIPVETAKRLNETAKRLNETEPCICGCGRSGSVTPGHPATQGYLCDECRGVLKENAICVSSVRRN